MVNHFRTLLLNLPGTGTPSPDFPGEELIPPDYRSVTLPPHLRTIYSVLFGADPDRAMLNYRAREYLSLLHATELDADTLAMDTRVTYLPFRNDLFLERAQPIHVSNTAGDAPLYIIGDPRKVREGNHLLFDWTVEASDETTLIVTQTHPTYSRTLITHDSPSGLTADFALPGSELRFRCQPIPTTQWNVRMLAKPSTDLGQIAATLRTSTFGRVAQQIFGLPAAGDYAKYQSLWQEHDELAYQLGGLLLAYVRRVDEVRLQSAVG